MDTLVLAARVLLIVVFATAGVGKLLDRDGSVQALRDFGVGAQLARIGGILLPVAELTVALLLLFPSTATVGAVGAILLLGGFIVGIGRALLEGRTPDCHCFGQIHSAPAGRSTLIRNGVLAAIALLVLIGGPGPAVDTWVGDRTGAELVAIGLGLLALAGVGFAIRLWLDNRKLRQDLADAEAGFPEWGLPVGARAPRFSLRDNDGQRVTLESLLERGRPIALVFVGPTCGSCWVIMPHIARWQQSLAERIDIVMVSTGKPEQNEEAIEEHQIVGTFLHDGLKTLEAYRLDGTPGAVLVSTDGRIASTTVMGGRTIEPFIRMAVHDAEPNGDVPPSLAATSAAA